MIHEAGIYKLWDDVSRFDAADTDSARNHLLAGISDLVGARNATWIGAVRLGDPQPGDPVQGWRPRAIRHLYPIPLIESLARQQAMMLEAGYVDHTTIANVAGSGVFRVSLLSELAPAGWFDGDYYRTFYLAAGHRDAIWAGVPVNEDAESYFGFYRGTDQAPYGEAEKAIVGFALRGLAHFHRTQMLGEGLGIASAPLTPLERRVLQGMLRGRSDKEIALALAQSVHTVREYARRIFRKYGVKSRTALMALWLGRPPA